jgi:hypothetical protein
MELDLFHWPVVIGLVIYFGFSRKKQQIKFCKSDFKIIDRFEISQSGFIF